MNNRDVAYRTFVNEIESAEHYRNEAVKQAYEELKSALDIANHVYEWRIHDAQRRYELNV